jgi:prepilin-type processing-associated H-X9-DG protein
VLLVISILFAMLMPALNRVRKFSTGKICEANLQQYCLAGILYMNDNDSKFPDGENEWLYSRESFSDDHPLGCRWHDIAMAPSSELMTRNPQYQGKMWGYINNYSHRTCPTFRRYARSRGCENPGHLKSISINPQYSYTMNGYLGTAIPGSVLKESEVRNPSRVFFFAEENSWSLRPEHHKFSAKWLPKALSTKALDDTMLLISSTSEAKDCFATYHGAPSGDINRGYGNVAFVDSHVERIRVEEQLEQLENGWPEDAAGNLSLAWASKELPGSNSNIE